LLKNALKFEIDYFEHQPRRAALGIADITVRRPELRLGGGPRCRAAKR
jgi:hypothetical protein